MALDADGDRVVNDLQDICWERHHDRKQVVRQVAPPFVLSRGHGWATVLLALQDRKRGDVWSTTRYSLTRWKKERGAWRLYDRFRLSLSDLRALGLEAPGFIARTVVD